MEQADPRGHPDAIVDPSGAEEAITVERLTPGPILADFVDYYWLVRWDVAHHRQQVVPQPHIHLAAENRRLLVYGIIQEPFYRELAGRGHVLGVAFHPGGFHPFLRASVASISGRVLTAGEVLGRDDQSTAAEILDTSDAGVMVSALEDYLEGVRPSPDPLADEVRRLVAIAEEDSTLTRVDELAEIAEVGVRTLQRRFSTYVGVGPKWVIQRFRLLDAAGVAHTGGEVDWARVAVELGFSDQSTSPVCSPRWWGRPLPPTPRRRERTPAGEKPGSARGELGDRSTGFPRSSRLRSP